MAAGSRKNRRPSDERAFSERLATARELRNLTLVELATESGVDKGQLSRLENKLQSRPSAEAVFRLSEVLDVRPEWLWRGTEPMDAEGAEKKLHELRRHLEQDNVSDKDLHAAIKKTGGRFHQTVIAVAKSLALSGERHTVDGWLSRFDEIESRVKPILPK